MHTLLGYKGGKMKRRFMDIGGIIPKLLLKCPIGPALRVPNIMLF
jgi:hypothetical protein